MAAKINLNVEAGTAEELRATIVQLAGFFGGKVSSSGEVREVTKTEAPAGANGATPPAETRSRMRSTKEKEEPPPEEKKTEAKKEEKKEEPKVETKRAPSAGKGKIDVAKLQDASRLREVVAHLVEDVGIDDVEKIVATCEEIKEDVPLLKRVADIPSRIKAAYGVYIEQGGVPT